MPTRPARPPEEDGDYVELYDADANANGDEEVANGAYEDPRDGANGHDDMNNQLDQANGYEGHGAAGYNGGDVGGNHGAAFNGPRLVHLSYYTVDAYKLRTIGIFGLFQNVA